MEMLPIPADWREILAWTTTPTVTPWVGALAALIAAVLASPFSWVRHFGLLLPRIVFTIAVWFAALWLINDVLTHGLNGLSQRLGWGGGGGNPGLAGPPAALPNGANTATAGPPTVTVAVRFLPDAADPKQVRDFACEVTVTPASGAPATVRVLADDWPSFERQLADALRMAASTARSARVRILTAPDPGPNTRERTRKLAHDTLPTADIRVEG
jgi:hypothetical protein